jgi:hypothetical protein
MRKEFSSNLLNANLESVVKKKWLAEAACHLEIRLIDQ